MVEHTCNRSPGEVEAGEAGKGRPQPHNKFKPDWAVWDTNSQSKNKLGVKKL